MSELKLKVVRFSDNGKETLSNVSIFDGENSLYAFAGMELPWKNNMPNVSCIPVGEYDCVKVGASISIPYSHVSITNVKGRSGVCIHKANFVRQLRGCVAIGDKHVDIDKDNLLDVTNSGKAFEVLMRMLPDKFKIEITQV